jgi:protein-L-isoaspartate(D-aspartate) O-methyltransferase
MSSLESIRREYAGEVQAACKLRATSLVEALATVPRERFLRPGPWHIRDDFGGRETSDADPRQVYQNASIAIDTTRQLFNGAPGAIAPCIDALELRTGEEVLHVGCGLGYYSAVMAHCVGPAGRVIAVEIDESLAAEARSNLASWSCVDVRQGNGVEITPGPYDAILVSTGLTHPHPVWLDALKPGGRLVFPLTFTTEQMGTLGKGVVILLTKGDSTTSFDARVLMMTMIYSAVGIRNAAWNDRLTNAFKIGGWPTFNQLRRDPHEPTSACWYHTDSFCFGIRSE